MYKQYFKRFLDIFFAVFLLIVLSPLIVIISAICKLTVGKVIYKQQRDGLFEKSFTMYKFQTMRDVAGDKYLRTPKVMRIIRSLGLDEIPQLINILKGDMSFVGPRPFITGEELPIYPDKIIYTAKPGLISLATANGRRSVSHKMRLKYDYLYVTNISFRLDIYIVFKTIGVMFKQNVRGEVWKVY